MLSLETSHPGCQLINHDHKTFCEMKNVKTKGYLLHEEYQIIKKKSSLNQRFHYNVQFMHLSDA